MKKFDRLPVETRKEEIKIAATRLFKQKGFHATTMENIISDVTLSKGGVYRIYPSTKAILEDIIIDGMHERNQFYESRAKSLMEHGTSIDVSEIVNILCDGMIMLPNISSIYAELLIQKRYDPELEALYQKICQDSMKETAELLVRLQIQNDVSIDEEIMWDITEIMNTAILGIALLNHYEDFGKYREPFYMALLSLLQQ